jgi:hypothetical protein
MGQAIAQWNALCSRLAAKGVASASCADRSAIVLGRDMNGAPVFLPERPRLEHTHVIGTTGGGKSKFLEHCLRQDISQGRGILLIDPHGEHPGSTYRSTLAWLNEYGYADLIPTRTSRSSPG